jgi:hypothetical protein
MLQCSGWLTCMVIISLVTIDILTAACLQSVPAIHHWLGLGGGRLLIPQVRPAHNYPNSLWEMIHPPGGDNAVCM